NVTNSSTSISTSVVRGRTGYRKVDYKQDIEMRPVWEVDASMTHTEVENILKAIIGKQRELVNALDQSPPVPHTKIDELHRDLENLVTRRRAITMRLSELLGIYRYGDPDGPGKESEAKTIRTLLHDYLLCDLPQFA